LKISDILCTIFTSKETKGGANVQYITGIHALNLPCSLLTCGDWHRSALKWEKITYRDSKDSHYGDWGIEQCSVVPEHSGIYAVANHIRALLDLLEIGNFSAAQGMNRDFIGNDDYTDEVFHKVALLSDLPHWHEIDSFMGSEYYGKWLDYKKQSGLDERNRIENKSEVVDYNTLEDSIKKYGIDPLCVMKINVYAGRDKVRDLYDLTYICNNYFDRLSKQTIGLLRGVVEHKGVEQFDYVVRNQPDELIDSDKLADDFLKMYDKLGLMLDENERELLENGVEASEYAEPLDDEDEWEQ
jgi:hypothetical protein